MVGFSRSAWRDFQAGGVDAVLGYYSEDCVCEDAPDLPASEVYLGWAGVRARDRHFRQMWGGLMEIEPVEFIYAGDGVVVVVTAIRAQAREGEPPVESTLAFVYDIRDGLRVRDRVFTSKRQALEAAGVPV